MGKIDGINGRIGLNDMRVIITGTTGMVGKGVLLECLAHTKISEVLIVSRRSLGINHPKLKEIIHKDFFDLSAIEKELVNYDGCFFCLGTTAIGKSEEEYTRITYDLTKHWCDIMYKLNPNMVFNYVSGTGTDSTEKGNSMWARVKGKTENYILKKGFKDAYMFRPGFILPEKGVKSSTNWYQFFYVILRPFFPLMKNMKSITTSINVGKAMINSLFKGYPKKHLVNKDINNLALNK